MRVKLNFKQPSYSYAGFNECTVRAYAKEFFDNKLPFKVTGYVLLININENKKEPLYLPNSYTSQVYSQPNDNGEKH